MSQPKKCPVCSAAMWYAGEGQVPFPGMGGTWHAWQCQECGAVLNTKEGPQKRERPEWILYRALDPTEFPFRHEWQLSSGQKSGAMAGSLMEAARRAIEQLAVSVSLGELLEATKTPGRPTQLEAEE